MQSRIECTISTTWLSRNTSTLKPNHSHILQYNHDYKTHKHNPPPKREAMIAGFNRKKKTQNWGSNQSDTDNSIDESNNTNTLTHNRTKIRQKPTTFFSIWTQSNGLLGAFLATPAQIFHDINKSSEYINKNNIVKEYNIQMDIGWRRNLGESSTQGGILKMYKFPNKHNQIYFFFISLNQS